MPAESVFTAPFGSSGDIGTSRLEEQLWKKDYTTPRLHKRGPGWNPVRHVRPTLVAAMSVEGHSPTSRPSWGMSALTPTTDLGLLLRHVCSGSKGVISRRRGLVCLALEAGHHGHQSECLLFNHIVSQGHEVRWNT